MAEDWKENPKTSWDYLEKVNKKEIKSFHNPNATKAHWEHFPKNTKFKDRDGWWIKTEDGREKLDDDDELLKPAIPLFCPKCGRIMNKDEDERAYRLTKMCFYCHINEHASENKEPNKHVIEKELEKIKDKIKENVDKKEMESNKE